MQIQIDTSLPTEDGDVRGVLSTSVPDHRPVIAELVIKRTETVRGTTYVRLPWLLSAV